MKKDELTYRIKVLSDFNIRMKFNKVERPPSITAPKSGLPTVASAQVGLAQRQTQEDLRELGDYW